MSILRQLTPGVCLNSIPGLAEVLAKAKAKQFRTREDSLLALASNIGGFKVRTITVRDYVLLDRYESPFINRAEPTMGQLALFLWVLSPAFGLWGYGVGWRKHFSTLQSVQAFFYSRKVAHKFGQNIPESSEQMVIDCFRYVDRMFFDAPPSVVGGGESCLCYLTGWFDALQSEYNFTNDAIWEMGLPELFQRLKAISQRHNPNQPKFDKNTDEVKLWVLRGLRSNEFTMDDLAGGLVEIPKSFLN